MKSAQSMLGPTVLAVAGAVVVGVEGTLQVMYCWYGGSVGLLAYLQVKSQVSAGGAGEEPGLTPDGEGNMPGLAPGGRNSGPGDCDGLLPVLTVTAATVDSIMAWISLARLASRLCGRDTVSSTWSTAGSLAVLSAVLWATSATALGVCPSGVGMTR
jgi:hypothetical protein